MKKLSLISISLLSLLLSTYSFADDECSTCTGTPPPTTPPLVTAVNNLAQTCKPTETADQNRARLDAVVAASGETPKNKYYTPTSRTSSSLVYQFAEQTLKPGESLYFSVPDDLAQRAVRFMILHHRQDPATETGFEKTTPKWDDVPGLTSVQVLSGSANNWRYWTGDASGSKGAKFAEVSNSVEKENLYEWRKKGHNSVATDEHSMNPLLPNAIRVKSTGQDEVRVSRIELKVAPITPDVLLESIYSSGTAFGDYETESGRTYGGGQNNKGKFPNAVVLGGSNTVTSSKPTVKAFNSTNSIPTVSDFEIKNGEIHVPLPEGYIVTSVEVAGGDSHPDEITNSDGGWGTKGWGQLNVDLKTVSGTDRIISGENVPPEGVMMGTPSSCDKATKKGDEIVIRGTSDKVYVMGVRVGLKKL